MPVWDHLRDRRGRTHVCPTRSHRSGVLCDHVVWATAGRALADRFGRVRTIRASLIIFMVFTAWFAFSDGFWMVAVAWSLWGLAMVAITGTDSAFLHDSLQAMGRERDFERQAGRAFAVRSGALVLATLTGGVIAGEIGGRGALLAGTTATGLALMISLLFREPPRHDSELASHGPSYMELLKETLRLPEARRRSDTRSSSARS